MRKAEDIRDDIIRVVMELHHAQKGEYTSKYADAILTLYDLCCELEEHDSK